MHSTLILSALLFCALARVGAGSRSSILLGQLDLHMSGPGHTVVNNTNTTVAALSFSQLGLNATTTIYGALAAIDFPSVYPPASPKDASERFELRVGDFGVDLSRYSDLFIFGAVVRGNDGPSRIAVSSSTDDFASSEELEFPAGKATDFSVRVKTGGHLPIGGVTVRFTAASAAGNSSTPDNYLGFVNSPKYGRFVVYSSPARCPVGSASGCVHGTRARTAGVTSKDHVELGMIDHGPYGMYECTATGTRAGAGHVVVPAERSLKVSCECTCFELPPDAEFDACAPGVLSSGHAYAGTVCAGGLVTDAAGAAAYAACDTIDGDLRLTFPSLEAVEFPRVRHISGELAVVSKVLSLKLPLLETVGGSLVQTAHMTSLEQPRLRSLCGAGLIVRTTQVPSVHLPMLQGTAAFVVITETDTPSLDIDLGSVGGGPTLLTGGDGTSYSCVMCVEGKGSSQQIARLAGLTALREIRSTAHQNDLVSFARLPKVSSLDFLRHTHLGGEAGAHQDVKLSLSSSSFAVQGDFESEGTWRISYLLVTNMHGLLSFKVPGLCGSTWNFLQVRSSQGMTVVDLGSVAGGPREISLDGGPMILSGHASSPLATVLGMTRLERVRGIVTGRTMRLEHLEPGAFPPPLLNAVYGEGAERLRIEVSRCEAPAILSFEALTDLASLFVNSVSGMTSFRLPRLASEEIGSFRISGNSDLTHVDLGSVGGGPAVIRSTTDTILFRLEGHTSAKISSIEGLTRLTAFESGNHLDGQVILGDITAPALPTSLLSASFGADDAATSLVAEDVTLGGGELVWPGVVGVRRIYVSRIAGVTAIRFPNLATPTMSQIVAQNNPDVTLLDFGSVGGGPTRIVHPSAAWGIPLDIRGKAPTLITTILGLDDVSEVACAHDLSDNNCVVRFVSLGTLPLNLIPAVNSRGRHPLSIYAQTNDFPTSIAFDFVNVTGARLILVEGNTGISALRVPFLNTTSMEQLHVDINAGLHTVDFGSIGGGPEELTGGADGNAACLRLRGFTANVIENVAGLSNLVRVSSYADKWNSVDVAYVGTNTSSLQDLLSNLQFADGANRLRLFVEDTPFTELRFTSVPSLDNLRVIRNVNLGVLRFPGTPADSIGEATIQGNLALPDGCANAIDPLAVLFSTGGSPSGACPP
eukprot:TRINITY_DN6980_c0_g3_i1.p1 TRINITY_DN6980_c0_g3~~TRINITY_DN6980_c0_g3_i1.p1  ORF type:complete len:1153 (-),score=242.89 TRINITY_DN6980_c0_g3_i1:511-3969(-)